MLKKTTMIEMVSVWLVQEVLKQLQGSIEDDAKDSQGQTDFLERLKGMRIDLWVLITHGHVHHSTVGYELYENADQFILTGL